jgi:hypothetical protein
MRNILHCLWARAGRGWQRASAEGGQRGRQEGGQKRRAVKFWHHHRFAAAQLPARNCSSSHERNRPPGIARPLELPAPALHIEIRPPYQSIFRKERAGDHIDDNTHCPIKQTWQSAYLNAFSFLFLVPILIFPQLLLCWRWQFWLVFTHSHLS